MGQSDAGISVIIPTFNRANLLRRALASVRSQTRAADEVIVVDDGSTDRTEAVVAEFADLPIRYKRQENAGPASARNRGFAMASRRYVALLDSDDEWLPTKLARQQQVLDAHPDVGLCFCDAGWTLNGQVEGQAMNWGPRRRSFGSALGIRPGWSGRICGSKYRFAHYQIGIIANPSTVLARAEVFEQAGGFRIDLKVAEDYEMWLRASRFCDYYYIDEPLCWVHAQSSSLTSKDQLQGLFRRNYRAIWQAALAEEADQHVRRQLARNMQVSWETDIQACLEQHDRRKASLALAEARSAGWAPTAQTGRLIRLAERFGPLLAVTAHKVMTLARLC
ncbi:MAG: glycosyltransferase family 2 protein [Planctomycetes bacterium]|nr:glycosyltransferase family 2 protein [Planctomycetota bacterium]